MDSRQNKKKQKTLTKLSLKLRWVTPIILGLSMLLVIVVLQISVERMFSRIAVLREPEINNDVYILVTVADFRYHRHHCDRIRGETREMTYRAARDRELIPCPSCFPQDFKL